MIMTLFIRKVTLNETYNSAYLYNLAKFLTVENLSSEIETALFEVFEAGQIFRAQRRFLLTKNETNNFRIHIPDETSLIGYTSLGVLEKSVFADIIQPRTNYNDLISKTQTFANLVGWTIHELKHIEYEIGDFVFESSGRGNYDQYPMNFNTIERLYNEGTTL